MAKLLATYFCLPPSLAVGLQHLTGRARDWAGSSQCRHRPAGRPNSHAAAASGAGRWIGLGVKTATRWRKQKVAQGRRTGLRAPWSDPAAREGRGCHHGVPLPNSVAVECLSFWHAFGEASCDRFAAVERRAAAGLSPLPEIGSGRPGHLRFWRASAGVFDGDIAPLTTAQHQRHHFVAIDQTPIFGVARWVVQQIARRSAGAGASEPSQFPAPAHDPCQGDRRRNIVWARRLPLGMRCGTRRIEHGGIRPSHPCPKRPAHAPHDQGGHPTAR